MFVRISSLLVKTFSVNMKVKSENDSGLAKCFNCDQEVDSNELEIHFLECQTKSVKRKVSKCNICDSDFESQEKLNCHILTAHKIKKFT